jgi:thiopurine S-methyltransferase
MEHEFWHTRWQKNEIGFHEGSVNQYLHDHWPDLSLTGTEKVFVPLCGKAQDLWWLHERGHTVLGVELSDIACRDFFDEAAVTPALQPGEPFKKFEHEALQLWCGDFFQLTADDLQDVHLVYDRAALIALPPAMREAYVRHLIDIIPAHAAILLITLDYPGHEMKGPPFNVSDTEVQSLYGKHFQIKQTVRQSLPESNPFAKRKGLSGASESVFIMRRISDSG